MNSNELIDVVLKYTSEKNYPDIHINTDENIKIRNKSGEIENLSKIIYNDNEINLPILSLDIVKELIIIFSGDKGLKIFEENMELDCSYKIEGGDRYRINCYIDTDGYSIAMRRIPNTIPSIDELGLGKNIKDMCNKSKGLILVTGPTGSGKSTNLASMVDYINNNYKKHIITIEDPVEFAIKSNKSLVNQREIGNHTKGFSQAIRASLREDPDIIMIGEMRDPETIKAAITLAETGHLVFSTLHTNDSVQTIDRIVDVFPGPQQKQIRMQLAMSLVGIVSQRLVASEDKDGRVAAREILISNDAVRNLIIQGKTHLLYNVLEVGQNEGMILMDKYLLALYNKKMISKDTIMSFARDKETIEMIIN